jgi:hypothetical protein
MLYTLTVGTLYIQTDNILTLTSDGSSTWTVTMNDAAVTTFTVTQAQYNDIIAVVNDNRP